MPTQKVAKVYTARSQFWVGNTFFRPIDEGGRAISESDPMLASHAHMFEEYHPRTREFGPETRVSHPTQIARLVAPDPEPEPDPPVAAHTHPHP